ncbi:MAG: hypothetical protein Q9163_003607 [Psora crenata]
MPNELLTSFLGALQASLSVLLVISYGIIAAQFDILKGSTTQQIIWGLFYAFTSMLLGHALTRIFKLPSWTTPAIAFNNTTALPLLLVQSLSSTGVLDRLLISDSDSSSDALLRAKSYFLINAMIGDTLTFALGPKLLDGEEAPRQKQAVEQAKPDGEQAGPEEHGDGSTDDIQSTPDYDGSAPNERTSLLPSFVVRGEEAAGRFSAHQGRKVWSHLPKRAQFFLHFSYAFLHAPLIGATAGAVVGLVTPLHRAFFGSPESGGIFKAWLTESIKNIGELFPALQIFVVGVKLSSSMRKLKRGEDSGTVPWVPMVIVIFIRFLMWPAISISIIYIVASRTALLDSDPMLWFTMMLMPTGPTAVKLTALADVSGSNESEKMSVAKFLSITYAVSPLICFTVVGALKACHAVINTL